MFCSKCGVQVAESTQFCPTCGQQLGTSQTTNTPPPTNTQASAPQRPDNYLVWAILSTLFCCLPFGIVSIIKSLEVNSMYDTERYAEAKLASETAKKWAMWGAIIAGIGYGIYIILIIIGVAAGL